ncbi:MAG TPA: hypothetical protein VMM38_09105 [Aridibacter sp.]|nr:hypothetical protein [Aridibacter sp.]
MKQCPKCGNTYTDETLSFCLTDGAVLEEIDGPDTEPFPVSDTREQPAESTRENARVKIDLSEREQPTAETVAETSVGSEGVRKGINIKIVVAIIVALLFLTALTSTVAVYLFFINSNGNVALPPAANANDNLEVEELKDRIEELSNRLENGSNSGRTPEDEPEISPIPDEDPENDEDPEYDEEVIKRVNSPGDGFLALRDRPSASTGNRLAKIPHGDIVVMERCQENTETIGGRTGRWCRIRWEQKTGWVFDVWLTD